MGSVAMLCRQAYEIAKSKGWHDTPVSFESEIANMHAELSEVWEEYRRGRDFTEIYFEGDKPCGVPIEFADVVLRIFDTCQSRGIDLEKALEMKMRYNMTRPYRYGGKRV